MRESGFEYLGADDSNESGGFVDFLKKEGPTLLSDVAEGVKSTVKTDASKAVDKLKKKDKPAVTSSGGSWFTQPALGPIPGGGVLALGLGLLGTIGYVLLKR